MIKLVSTILIFVWVVFQPMTNIVDAHPLKAYAEILSSTPIDNNVSVIKTPPVHDLSTTDIPSSNEMFHCHHHSSHCHIYLLSVYEAETDILTKYAPYNSYLFSIPETPFSASIRPPIA